MASPPPLPTDPRDPRDPRGPRDPDGAHRRTPGSTKRRLIEAAERLIAERGIESLSIRAVTQAAGVSVSAANYHFGSKDALVRETLWRALGSLNERRLALLEGLEEAGVPEVEDLVEAFLRPAFDLQGSSPPSPYQRLVGQLHSGTLEVEERIKRELLNPSFQRYVAALSRVLPHRPRDELALAFQFALGAALHALQGQAQRLADVAPLTDAALLERLVRFAAAGIRATRPAEGEAP